MDTKEKFNPTEFAQKKAQEMAEKFSEPEEETVTEDEEVQDEPVEVEDEVEEEQDTEPVEEVQEEVELDVAAIDDESEAVAALKKELARVKGKLRQKVEVVTPAHISLDAIDSHTESKEITPAEVRLFTAWRNEALEDLIDEHPKYKSDPRQWELFKQELQDRVPELEYAKRHNIPITKKFFKERLTRVHRAISDNTVSARNAGKAELLKAQSTAQVMAAGSKKGEIPRPVKAAPRRLFPKKSNSLDAWVAKKK